MTHHQPELLVADSFRVRAHHESGEAEVRNLHAHFGRFKAAAFHAWQSADMQEPARPEEIRAGASKAKEIAGIQPSEETWTAADSSARTVGAQTPEQRRVSQVLEAFLDDARQQIAAFGEGWPRLELRGAPAAQQSLCTGQQLRLSLRPLPELGKGIEARTAGHAAVDHPERKGPNIRRYAKLNQELRAEALLTDALGQVIEGATTSLLWWRDGTLYASRDGGRVASVTEQMLRDFATSRLVPVRRGNEYPAKLASYEVWAVNALHGIRIVTSIDGVVLPSPDKNRLHAFQEALEATWQPVRRDRAFR